jgi:hypothetical protein
MSCDLTPASLHCHSPLSSALRHIRSGDATSCFPGNACSAYRPPAACPPQTFAPFTGTFRPVQKLAFLTDGQQTGGATCNTPCCPCVRRGMHIGRDIRCRCGQLTDLPCRLACPPPTVAGAGGSQGLWTLTVADVAPKNAE